MHCVKNSRRSKYLVNLESFFFEALYFTVPHDRMCYRIVRNPALVFSSIFLFPAIMCMFGHREAVLVPQLHQKLSIHVDHFQLIFSSLKEMY